MSSNAAINLSPPAVANNTPASMSDVLTNDSMLGEILCRLGCPGCLVNAALTDKRWLRGASVLTAKKDFDPSKFCERHLPRLLGFYVSSIGISGSEFFLQADASRPEVSATLTHANFGFGDFSAPYVWDCRNGDVLFDFGEEPFNPVGLAVRSPLRYPNNDAAVVFPPHPPTWPQHPHAMLLPVDRHDDVLCYRVDLCNWGNRVVVVVRVLLPSKTWAIRCAATGRLPKSPMHILPPTVLAGGKICMATEGGYLIALDLATSRLFTIDLPEAVESAQYQGNLINIRGDESALYLYQVDGDKKLNVWLRRMNDGIGHGGDGAGTSAARGWILKDSISLRETCGHLVERGWDPPADGNQETPEIMVVGAGDNAEFVYLEFEITGVIVYMHLKTGVVKQVYKREADDDHYITIHPIMLVRRPVFPPPPNDDAGEAAAALHQA